MSYSQVDTLVAVVNNTADFFRAEREGWYRIPRRSAPAALEHVRYLAFYHTRAFGELRWAIHFVAPIQRIDLVRRLDLLPDEPVHPRAADLYYRLGIAPLVRLPRSVPSARLRRIVFIPTTLAKLQAAQEINDLFHESPLEDAVWQEFKREGIEAERQYYVAEGSASYWLDFAIFCSRRNVDVECDGDTWHARPDAIPKDNARNNFLTKLGWSVLRYSSKELAADQLSETISEIRAAVNRFGGLEATTGGTRAFVGEGESFAEQLRLW